MLAEPFAPRDIPSLSTVFSRSFHPRNAYMRAAIPDTPLTRQWWTGTFERALADETETILVVREPAAPETSDAGETVLGVIRVKRFELGDTDNGFWTGEWSADHEPERCRAFIELYGRQRVRLLGDRPHLVILPLGTDYTCIGRGVGTALLGATCRLADAARLPLFVMAGIDGKGFYERFGFELVDQVRMEGEIEYTEYMLMRRAGT